MTSRVPLTVLLERMQTMQASYRALAKNAKSSSDKAAMEAVGNVLSDLIRLTAELREGDGLRGNLPDENSATAERKL